jgi:hypothetical protein
MKIFILSHETARRNALEAVKNAPDGYEVKISEKTRSVSQNAHLWAVLSDISEQVDWYGQKLSAEDWKHILSASLLREQRMAPGINGGFVVLGQSTSKMTKAEFSDLLELAYAFGSEKGVTFHVSQQEFA